MISSSERIGESSMEDIRSYNIGKSDYSKRRIQSWDIWIEYKLNPFDADIVKRVLRNKIDTPRCEDYEKIVHICKERIRQIDKGEDPWGVESVNNEKDNVSAHCILPLDICVEYKLNSFDKEIIECILRNNIGDMRRDDYTIIIHNCNQRIRLIGKESRLEQYVNNEYKY